MSSLKKILIICDSDLSREPRVIRQILALKDSYQLYTAGDKPTDMEYVQHFNFLPEFYKDPKHWSYPVPLRKAVSFSIGLYNRYKNLYKSYYYENDYWNERRKEMLARLKGQRFDLIFAHHWDTLPLACEVARGTNARLIFNAHDYYPRQFEDNINWYEKVRPGVNYIMDRYLPKFDYIFSAWTKIHEDFRQQYGVPSIIINNATEFNDLKPQLRDETVKNIRIVHHGIANPNRKIEAMIDMMDHLDERFTLDFILVDSGLNGNYLEQLKERAAKHPGIRFLDPVPTREIAKTINNYDIGLFLLPPNGFNPTFLLPNKLFEFIQGRLACLVSPSIEMKTIVEQYDLGWISRDFEPASIAAEIRDLSIRELNEKKLNADKCAFKLSAEENYKKMKQIVDQLLASPEDARTPASTARPQGVSVPG